MPWACTRLRTCCPLQGLASSEHLPTPDIGESAVHLSCLEHQCNVSKHHICLYMHRDCDWSRYMCLKPTNCGTWTSSRKQSLQEQHTWQCGLWALGRHGRASQAHAVAAWQQPAGYGRVQVPCTGFGHQTGHCASPDSRSRTYWLIGSSTRCVAWALAGQ